MVTSTLRSVPAHRRLGAVLTLAALLLCAVVPASAQIVFTVTGTANSTANGYTSGQSYTFVFTSANSFANTDYSAFDSEGQKYTEETVTDPQMWTSIGGTGLAGSYVRPIADTDDAYSYLQTTVNHNQLDILAGADTSTSIGLQTLGGTSIAIVRAWMSGTELPTFAAPAAYAEPFNATTGYWAGYTGTYSGFTGPYNKIAVYSLAYQTTYMEFTPTSLTISAVGAVPEPSTYAAFAGLAAFGLVLLRRRRANVA